MREIWKPVKVFEGLYEVSNLGVLKRLSTALSVGTGNYPRKERIATISQNNKGYLKCDLWKNGKRYQKLVHRLVAQAFVPNPNNYPVVNHKDENKENNSADNLEWCNQKYNMNYGSCSNRIGKANSKKVVMLSKNHEKIETFDSIIGAERKTGISNGSIVDCLHGRRKTAGGYIWKYET